MVTICLPNIVGILKIMERVGEALFEWYVNEFSPMWDAMMKARGDAIQEIQDSLKPILDVLCEDRPKKLRPQEVYYNTGRRNINHKLKYHRIRSNC